MSLRSRRRTKWSNRRPPRGVEPRALSTVRPTGWPGQQVSFVRPQCQTSCLDIVGQVDFQLQSERGSAASIDWWCAHCMRMIPAAFIRSIMRSARASSFLCRQIKTCAP